MAARDWVLIFLLGGLWGSSFPLNAILLRELDPLWISAARITVGAMGSWVLLLAMKRKLPRDWQLYGRLFILGVFSYAVPFALFPLAQQHLASGVAAILNAMTPMMTVLVSHFWPGGERATWHKSIGVVAGLAGVAVLASPAFASGGTSQLWAVGACLAATICYATTLNYARGMKVDPMVLATSALTGAAAASVPVAFFARGTPVISTALGWAALLAIGLVATALAFHLMYRMLPRIGATNFSIVTFIAPVSAIAISVTFLGERIMPVHVAGMVCIFAGLLLVDGRILGQRRVVP